MAMGIRFPGSYDDIEALAAKWRARVQSTAGDMEGNVRERLSWLVSKLGGTIEIATDPCDQEIEGASLVIRDKHDFTIWLSPYTSPLRDNFTIAHELGHYLLHYDHRKPRHEGDDPVVFYRYGSDEYEWQANRFAAAFLMPRQEFERVYYSRGKKVDAVAGHFQVSRAAAEVRKSALIPND